MQHAFCPSNHGLTQCRQESILSTQSIRHNLSRKLMRHHLVKSLQSCSETATGIYWNVAKKKIPDSRWVIESGGIDWDWCQKWNIFFFYVPFIYNNIATSRQLFESKRPFFKTFFIFEPNVPKVPKKMSVSYRNLLQIAQLSDRFWSHLFFFQSCPMAGNPISMWASLINPLLQSHQENSIQLGLLRIVLTDIATQSPSHS